MYSFLVCAPLTAISTIDSPFTSTGEFSAYADVLQLFERTHDSDLLDRPTFRPLPFVSIIVYWRSSLRELILHGIGWS